MNEENLILKVETRPAVGELVKHVSELGTRFVFVDNRNFPDGKLYVIARVVENVKEPYESAEPRAHTVDAVMIFMGLRSDLKGLKVQVMLNDRWFTLESPAAVYVPAHTRHTYRILEGSGIYMKIVLAPHGDYNAVTY